ncbi:GNAT family N-acetyltransferase [Priestia megaterium]|nr:GNAT family N-acetyltransferase [Priestia megaterium]
MNIRLLTKEDADSYWALRLRALKDHPESFVLSYEEEYEKEIVDVREKFLTDKDRFIVGAFIQSQLVGVVGFRKQQPLKVQHKGDIWGMYVAPEARGKGVGKALLNTAIEQAMKQEDLLQIYLVVATTNKSAKALYERIGFLSYAVEKRALRVDHEFIDEEHMVLYVR